METYLIPCLLGLEKLVSDEVKRLGLQEVQAENGRDPLPGNAGGCGTAEPEPAVRRTGAAGAGPLPGPQLRGAVSGDPCHCVGGLSAGERRLPGEGLLHFLPAALRAGLPVHHQEGHGGANEGPLSPGAVPGGWREVSGALLPVQGRGSLCLDTSGEGLYKRGYRAVGWRLPCGRRWRRHGTAVPLSGEGPLLRPLLRLRHHSHRAALIAKNRAPGLDRSFDAQRWAFLPAKVWMDAADEAMDKEFHGHYDIWGGDIDPRAVAIARDNAARQGWRI